MIASDLYKYVSEKQTMCIFIGLFISDVEGYELQGFVMTAGYRKVKCL